VLGKVAYGIVGAACDAACPKLVRYAGMKGEELARSKSCEIEHGPVLPSTETRTVILVMQAKQASPVDARLNVAVADAFEVDHRRCDIAVPHPLLGGADIDVVLQVPGGIRCRLFVMRNSRHTYSTLLRSVGTEFKVMQELLRHSSFRSTLDVYTQAVTPAKHAAQAAVMSLVFSSDKDGPAFVAG
jgi:hypothetical protein